MSSPPTEIEPDVDDALSRLYEEGDVQAFVMLKVDTDRIDRVAEQVAGLPAVESADLVTGEHDLVLRVRFQEYANFQAFVVDELTAIDEVRETETMMVVTSYR